MDYVTRSLGRLTALICFMVMLAACGGAPGDNPNISVPGQDEEPEVDDGVTNISFVSASASQIYLRGQGGNENTIITFRATDSSGNPEANVALSFSLSTDVGGVQLKGSTQGVRTNEGGDAFVSLASGTVATPVRVIASLDGSNVTATSSDITISSGIPVASRFSLSAGPDWGVDNSRNTDGVTVELNIRASDQFGNPAFDGIQVSFWTPESGLVEPSCSLSNGSCSVTWESAGSSNNAPDFNASVIAFTQGAESFTDLNGNFLYDEGEAFVDLPEPYVDEDEDGAYSIGEAFVDTNKNGTRDAGNGIYDGPCITEGCTSTTVTIARSAALYLCSGTASENDYDPDPETAGDPDTDGDPVRSCEIN